MKPGYDGRRKLPGRKVGSYWSHNTDRGLPNHGSTTLLLDDETGFPLALVSATYLNALRTAALATVAHLFADTLDQTYSIGEFQYLAGTETQGRVTASGAVINGRAQGRTSDDAITIYDNSGISLQNLAVAGYVLEKALSAGLT